jgi:scyllo-inositol 2-dehydrogenase (NADP+)
MKVVVVGLGVQGYKRRQIAGADCVATVDPVNGEAAYKDLTQIPLPDYDAALLCVPDDPKLELLTYLVANGKHALVEKPLWAKSTHDLERLQGDARRAGVVVYTAYNHRFEPHYVRMRDLISSGELGRIHRCRMFYGNGTAQLVRESVWRDKGAGVLPDLGSHLLDTARFWFGADAEADYRVISASHFENRAFDHVVIGSETARPKIELEMTLLMWRNHFTCDILAEEGSAHITSLCKWGPTQFIHRRRVRPSGRPAEDVVELSQADPTWAAEYAHFVDLCTSRAVTDLTGDIWLQGLLSRLGEEAMAGGRAS